MLALVALGHDGRRVVQLMALALPVLAWLAWPVHSAAVHRVRAVVVCVWALLFAADAVVRAYLLDAYRAAPDSTVVLAAAANTTAREAGEYLSMHWRALAVGAGLVAAALWLVARSAKRGVRAAAPWPRWGVALVCVLLLPSVLGYASKPWRRLHPVAFWGQWNESVHALRQGWRDQAAQRDATLDRARAAAPVLRHAGPSTVVLVVTDSINRDNMGLYGYARDTTPRLQSMHGLLGDDMVVLRNAWSVDANTVESLRNIFGFGQHAADMSFAAASTAASPAAAGAVSATDGLHAIALARAAGYKVWWMSNHDDVAIEQEHARLADVVDMVNRTPGRAGASLDGELLDCLQEALDDPAERKLIVLHLMGAHPHYRLRFPRGENPVDDSADATSWCPRRCSSPARARGRVNTARGCICRTTGKRWATAATGRGTAPALRRATASRPSCGATGLRSRCRRPWRRHRFAPTGRAGRWPMCCASTGPARSPSATSCIPAIAGSRRCCRRAWCRSPTDESGPLRHSFGRRLACRCATASKSRHERPQRR